MFKTDEGRSIWLKYVNIEVLNYNTRNKASIGCEPSRRFQGRNPWDFLDWKTGICWQTTSTRNYQVTQNIVEQTEMICQDVWKYSRQTYIKNKAYYAKRQMSRNWAKVITCTFYSLKQNIREVNFSSQIFGGLVPISLKRLRQRTMISYMKSERPIRKSFIARYFVHSRLYNPHPTNKTLH